MKLKDKLQQVLLQNKERADSFLFLLSLLALGLFASNEIVAMQPNLLPMSKDNWAAVQLFGRFAVWISFVAHFITYGMLSGNPLKYARGHLIQLLICLAWFPHHDASILRNLTDLLSVETVQLIGTLANGYLVVRHIVRSLKTHPLVVTGSAFLFVIVTASELLVQVEPETFKNLFDALWYSIVTTTTIGYGDIVPHSFAGRCIGIVLMISGISLAGAFIGIVAQFMQKRLGQHDEQKETAQLKAKLAEEQARTQRLIEALEKDNELKAKLLEHLLSKPK